jgi:hypothetical protein
MPRTAERLTRRRSESIEDAGRSGKRRRASAGKGGKGSTACKCTHDSKLHPNQATVHSADAHLEGEGHKEALCYIDAKHSRAGDGSCRAFWEERESGLLLEEGSGKHCLHIRGFWEERESGLLLEEGSGKHCPHIRGFWEERESGHLLEEGSGKHCLLIRGFWEELPAHACLIQTLIQSQKV